MFKSIMATIVVIAFFASIAYVIFDQELAREQKCQVTPKQHVEDAGWIGMDGDGCGIYTSDISQPYTGK
jgi:hypothetical protein